MIQADSTTRLFTPDINRCLHLYQGINPPILLYCFTLLKIDSQFITKIYNYPLISL